MNWAISILNLFGIIFCIVYAVGQVQDFILIDKKSQFFQYKRFRHGIGLILVFGIPFILVNYFLSDDTLRISSRILQHSNGQLILSILFAFAISFIWSDYIRRLDLFEPERKKQLLVPFVLSSLITMTLVIPIYGLAHDIGLSTIPTSSFLYDFFYCIFVIGGIEEFSKIIPVAIVLRFFPKYINEPIDYIVYGSISALGFAFIENISYISASELHNVGGRALYAAVAHMTFTSTICYGLMLRKYFPSRYSKRVIPLSIFIAMFAHGFYDLWLIHLDGKFGFVTVIFFLLTIQIWFTMKNNSINISPFYDKRNLMNNDALRHFLILSLTGLIMLGYITIAGSYGAIYANQYLYHQVFAFGYLIFYLAFGLSRYEIIPKHMNPLTIPIDWIIPRPLEKTED